MGPENAAGHYTSYNLLFPDGRYPREQIVRKRYKAKYGANEVTNAVMEAAFTSKPTLLAQAIEKVGSPETDALIYDGLPGQEFKAPQGTVKIDKKPTTRGCGPNNRQGS